MIRGKNIVCISNTTWYGPFTKSTVQIMSRLSYGNKLLFVEYPYTFKDVVLGLLRKGNAPVKRILGLQKRIQTITTEQGTRVHQLIAMPVIPCDFIKNETIFRILFGINAMLYRISLKRAIKQLNMKDLIFISAYNPYYGMALKGKLNEQVNVYYSYDGPNVRRHGKRVIGVDAAYAAAADAVVSTSEYLTDEKRKFNPGAYTVKNGVDFELFSKNARTGIAEGPVKIGYIGSMDFRFDIDMVETAVNALRDYEFHFIGLIRNKVIRYRLEQYPNVRFSDPVPPGEVPQLLSSFSAGIIPYLQNDINKNIYPLKINEYLACGVPVIMSRFALLPEFDAITSIVSDPSEFTLQIRKQVEEDNLTKIRQRIEFASGNSWDRKASEFSDILENLLSHVN